MSKTPMIDRVLKDGTIAERNLRYVAALQWIAKLHQGEASMLAYEALNPLERHPVSDGTMGREQAIELARRYAKAYPQSYYSEPFMPHEWVIEAIQAAADGKDTEPQTVIEVPGVTPRMTPEQWAAFEEAARNPELHKGIDGLEDVPQIGTSDSGDEKHG